MNGQLPLFDLRPAEIATTSLQCQRWDNQRRQKLRDDFTGCGCLSPRGSRRD